MSSALILLSGGLDSATLLAYAATVYKVDDLLALSIRYNQRHENQEMNSAQKISNYYGVEHFILHLPPSVFWGSESTLLDAKAEMPHMTYEELAKTQGISPTYVPFRNGLFLSLATAFALIRKYDDVLIATHAEDARNWAYPDCTPEFNGAMANAVYIGTYRQVRLVSPFQWMMKKDVVALGLSLKVPYELSWSCYEGGLFPCGTCPTCVERLEAFRANGVEDPLNSRIPF